MEPGRVAHSTAFEGVSAKEGSREPEAAAVPAVYTMRVGLADELDLGLRAAAPPTAAMDVKWNPIRGPVDFAFDPGLQWALGEVVDSGYAHLPLLAGVNLSSSFSFVVSAGMVFGIGEPRFAPGPESGDVDMDRVFARLGLGLNCRATPGFAVHPEVTLLRTLSAPDVTVVVAGLGFNFGALPRF